MPEIKYDPLIDEMHEFINNQLNQINAKDKRGYTGVDDYIFRLIQHYHYLDDPDPQHESPYTDMECLIKAGVHKYIELTEYKAIHSIFSKFYENLRVKSKWVEFEKFTKKTCKQFSKSHSLSAEGFKTIYDRFIELISEQDEPLRYFFDSTDDTSVLTVLEWIITIVTNDSAMQIDTSFVISPMQYEKQQEIKRIQPILQQGMIDTGRMPFDHSLRIDYIVLDKDSPYVRAECILSEKKGRRKMKDYAYWNICYDRDSNEIIWETTTHYNL